MRYGQQMGCFKIKKKVLFFGQPPCFQRSSFSLHYIIGRIPYYTKQCYNNSKNPTNQILNSRKWGYLGPKFETMKPCKEMHFKDQFPTKLSDAGASSTKTELHIPGPSYIFII